MFIVERNKNPDGGTSRLAGGPSVPSLDGCPAIVARPCKGLRQAEYSESSEDGFERLESKRASTFGKSDLERFWAVLYGFDGIVAKNEVY